MNLKTASWDLRNAWPLASGEVAVREEFQSLLTPTGTVQAAFTVRNPRTDCVWHYLVTAASSAPFEVKVYVYDENFVELEVYDTGATGTVRAVSASVVEDELLISSPDFPTVWGLVGSGLVRATKVSSVNPNTTAVNVPRGLSVSWAGRAVVSDGETLWFSDALYPRTFVAENAINPPGGVVYGLHVNSGGALIVCTSTGVYALPEDAAASGQVVIGVWSKLTDYSTTNYNTTASAQGRVYGLTQKGWRVVDDRGSDELLIDEKVQSRIGGTGRNAWNDYRAGRLFGGINGPIVTIGKVMHWSDLATGLKSWVVPYDTSAQPFVLRGLLYENNGRELYVTESRVFRQNGSNGDETDVQAQIAGRANLPPETSPVVRHVTVATDAAATTLVAVNTSTQSIATTANSPVIGTSSWGTVYSEPELKSVQTDWAVRGDEITFTAQVTKYPNRLPPVLDVVFKGPGRMRPV